jgi:cytochrome c551/c552
MIQYPRVAALLQTARQEREANMRKLSVIFVLLLVLSLVACGGGSAPSGGQEEPAGQGDAAAGEALYNQSLIGTQPGCMTCHSLEPGVTMVGPSLAVIGAEAGTRVEGVSAEDYLRQSILEPNAFVAEGFAQGLMPAALAGELTAQQVDDLVAFLLTLK